MSDAKRVEVIDSLRGLAALAVVLYHYIGFIPLLGIPVGRIGSNIVAVTRYGYVGVPVFFVLSGFVIAMTAARYPFTLGTGCRFVLRRLARIAPPYWVMIALVTATIIVGHSAGYFKNTVLTPGQVAAHFAYSQDLLGLRPLDVAYWTLCLEVQFYLVFAASAVALHSRGAAAQSGWFAALTAGSFVIDVLGEVPPALFVRLWYQFGLGVLAYYAGRDLLALLALATLLPAILGLGVYRDFAIEITVAVTVMLLLLRNRSFVAAPSRLNVLFALGRVSYSLYLVHGFVGMALAVWFRSSTTPSEAESWVLIATALVLALAFAVAFYYVCERRAVGWSHRVQVGSARGTALVYAAQSPNHKFSA